MASRCPVVICLKICTFVVSATTSAENGNINDSLWFAWKFVPLWYQQQPTYDALYSTCGCDLLENLYLCGISNNKEPTNDLVPSVVICLKICTFVVSATTRLFRTARGNSLWFAWKFVPLWYQQQRLFVGFLLTKGCDLLENLYLCGISNNVGKYQIQKCPVVICLKICTFVVSATTVKSLQMYKFALWFAWKFVPLWYQQQHQV